MNTLKRGYVNARGAGSVQPSNLRKETAEELQLDAGAKNVVLPAVCCLFSRTYQKTETQYADDLIKTLFSNYCPVYDSS
jgi:hypothetical protein